MQEFYPLISKDIRMKRLTFWGAFLAVFSLVAQHESEKKQQDIQAIKDMCGCYGVMFKYTETFAPEIDYEKKMDYTAGALELALPILEEDNRISIQHLLIINDSMVIKHWRQDWEYENRKVFTYDKDYNWTFKNLPAEAVKGQWTQKVFQTDDSPRYSGSSTWVHVDGKHYWENQASSPLPRREYTKRQDYNVMIRGNRHEITDFGWLHEQDNDKIVRGQNPQDILLVQEKGMNTYTRVKEEKCQLAKDWWAKHGDFWATVRASWEEVYAGEGDLSLLKKLEEKPLYKHLYYLQKNKASSREISELINKFISNPINDEKIEGK